ncbi:MAG: hypothetical protein NDI81_05435 [Desulfobacula sp.]|nr:hypothetical protein [Desulfobacula sp.]
MKILLCKAIVPVLILFLMLPPAPVRADDYEAYQSAQSSVENAAARIRMAEGAVGQVLMEAMSGKYGELHKWSLIDEKMADLEKTIDGSLSEIGGLAGVLVKVNPNYRFPSVDLGHPFEGNLNMARNKKQELLELAKQENAKLQKLNDMLAKVDKALYNATKGSVGDTIEGFLPSEVQLGGEAAVIVLGAYFGPPGMMVAGLGVFATFTFNTVVSMYYNASALADQIKALTPMKEMLQTNKQTVEKNVNELNRAAQEMQQIEQVLDQHQKRFDGLRQRVAGAQEGWGAQAQSAYQEKQAAAAAQARALAEAPKKPIDIHSSAYGMGPIPPIQPGEYSGEIDSIVTEMESYCKAVEDGGDPDNFSELVSNWEKKWSNQYEPIWKDYGKKYEEYQKASEICWQKRHQAWLNYVASFDALRKSYIGKYWDEAAQRAADSISATYNAADQSALAALAPSGQALAGPIREMARLNQVRSGVMGPFSMYNQRVVDAVNFHTSEFWKKTARWGGTLGEALMKSGQALTRIPYYSKGYQERADNIDAEASRAIDWGADAMGLKAEFLAVADQLKAIGKDVKEGIRAYDAIAPELHRVINVGRAELEAYIAAYGKLVNHPRAGRYYMGDSQEFAPNTTETSERVKWMSEYVKTTLTYTEPLFLEEAKKINWEGLARIFETKANEFNAYVDWVEQYMNRQGVAANRLDKVCRDLTGLSFYGSRDGFPQDFVQKELLASEWASITVEIEKYASEADYKRLPQAGWLPWQGLSPAQKLNAAQTLLLIRINTEMKNHVQARSSGRFLPVPDDVVKPLEEAWKGIKALCVQYEAQAKPMADKMGNAPEDSAKEISAVAEIWNRMPELSKKTVSSEYSRFFRAAEWFRGYLQYKGNAVKVSLLPPDNSTAAQIENLIGNYRAELEKWKAQQAREQEEYEKRQRGYEEEQARLKAEEEGKKRAEEERSAASLSSVSALYDQFKQAYESRNDSQIMSFMGDDWEAGDGTTLSDLEENISRNFKTFDEIKYNIQNLKIELKSEGRYLASYDVTITSRIYKRNLKHEEKSSVNEEIVIDGSGKPRIARTMNGRFWYVE